MDNGSAGRVWTVFLIVAAIPLMLLLLFVPATASEQFTYGLDRDAIPEGAREQLDTIEQIRASACPELPLVWVIAHVQAESSWQPDVWRGDTQATGLYQMLRPTWQSAGGTVDRWPNGVRPPADHPVFQVASHLETAIPWVCSNLRRMTAHLEVTGKTAAPLDAMLVCHLAGCGRVLASDTGIPEPGDARCGVTCVGEVTEYIERIHALVDSYTKITVTAVGGLPGPPSPWLGGPTGCIVDDPTTGGCITGATNWMIDQIAFSYGEWPWGHFCFGGRPSNSKSDHPKGKACDYVVGTIGALPGPEATAEGWRLASWLQAYAEPLDVNYIVWQGYIWDVDKADRGWLVYSGGGNYNPDEPTGGHYDHLHISLKS